MAFPRKLTEGERALLRRFATLLSQRDSAALQLQIDAAEITKLDSGHTSYSVPSSVPALTDPEHAVLDGFYRDEDGEPVTMIVHFEFPRGTLSWDERFRLDAEPLVRRDPAAEDIRFTLEEVWSRG